MKKIITYGTFDLFHIGHLNILKNAKAEGDYLIVAVSTDEFNRLKNKVCVYSYAERATIVEAIKYVDEVIPEKNWQQKITDVKKHQVDVFIMGDDWQGKFDFLAPHCRVIYLPRTPDVSTTEIKNQINIPIPKQIK